LKSATQSRGSERRSSSVSHNLFFALQPDEKVRAQIEAVAHRLKNENSASGRWVKPHRYHLTLRYLGAHGTLPEALLTAADDCGDRVHAPPFAFALDIAGSFANRSIPWWIGCGHMPPGLGALWDAISAGLAPHGLPAPAEDRAPHVTILRDADRRLIPMPIEPIAWRVEEFVLVDSLLGPGASHTVLRRWRLSD